MDDLISRQAAIDTLCEECSGNCIPCDSFPCGEVEALQKLPTAQQWIPCEERLPEPKKAVLGYAPRWKNVFALYYDLEYGWMVWSPISDDCFPNMYGDIVAWMPMPEPYKEISADLRGQDNEVN